MSFRDQKAVALLRKAADTIEQRSQEYLGVGDMFDKIAEVAEVDVDTVFTVLTALKLIRIKSNAEHLDSYIDLIAYSALKYGEADCLEKLVDEAKEKSARKKVIDSMPRNLEELREINRRAKEDAELVLCTDGKWHDKSVCCGGV